MCLCVWTSKRTLVCYTYNAHATSRLRSGEVSSKSRIDIPLIILSYYDIKCGLIREFELCTKERNFSSDNVRNSNFIDVWFKSYSLEVRSYAKNFLSSIYTTFFFSFFSAYPRGITRVRITFNRLVTHTCKHSQALLLICITRVHCAKITRI